MPSTSPVRSIIALAAFVTGGVGTGIFGYTTGGRIINAGTINGDINLGNSAGASYYGSTNVLIAAAGGQLNGNLALGSGNDTLVVALVNKGAGSFAGISGTVTGGGSDTLRYVVDTSASASLTPSTPLFNRLGYELSGGAVLTLIGEGQSRSVDFAGTGKVDLTADLSLTAATVLNLNAQSLLVASYPAVPNVLDVTSHGTLTETRIDPYAYASAVTLSTGSSFTNAGTINLRDTAATASSGLVLSAITGSGTVTNSGTINLTSGIAIGSNYYYYSGNLIVANGGISGSFTTVNQPSTIFGFLRQSSNSLQLFGQFALDSRLSPQTATTVIT